MYTCKCKCKRTQAKPDAEIDKKRAENKPLTVTLLDGKIVPNVVAHVTTPMDIAKGISNSLGMCVYVYVCIYIYIYI